MSAALLSLVASACAGHETLCFRYPDREGALQPRRVEPHRLACTGRRWYLMAWDTERQDWRTFRVDRLARASLPGARFVPRKPPREAADFVSQSIASGPYRHQARILMHAPAEAVAARTSPAAGRVEPRSARTCVLHTGADSLDTLALYVALKGFDFEVLAPPELIAHVRLLGERCARAAR